MITNRQFISRLAKHAGMTSSEATYMLEHFSNLIVDTLKTEDSITINGFGVFEKKKKAEKRLFNPATRQMRVIPASTTIAFKQSPLLKARFNQGSQNTTATTQNTSDE